MANEYIQHDHEVVSNTVAQPAVAKLLAKVMLFMALGLAITFGLSFGLFYAFLYFFGYDGMFVPLIVSLVVGLLGSIITSIVFSVKSIKNRGRLLIPYLVYAVFFGLALMFVPLISAVAPDIVLMAGGVTVSIFIVMGIIGLVSKVDLSPLATIGIGLFFGAIFLSLLNLIFYLTGLTAYVNFLYILVEALMFMVILIFTVVDFNRIKRITMSEANPSQNIVVFCAFMLYVDFINIFLRVLRILLIVMGRRR
ncbi:MAG: Bax inhibitor-1 family protein [Erysipelotrichaceae bacterium]|jgi:FtsH-binding integral membrane protein|nr:Bax inhibitor-1 family protein [Erysipelotrichaceae bacterium]